MNALTAAKQLVGEGRFADALIALGDSPGHGVSSEADVLRVTLFARTGRYSQTRDLASRLLKARNVNAADRSACEYALGLMDWDEGDTDRAIEHLQKSILLAKHGHDLERLCWSQLCLWAMLAGRHEVEVADPLFAEVRANTTKLGDAHVLVALHIYVAEAEGKRGSVKSAGAHVRTAVSLLNTKPNVWLEAWAEHVQLALALISADLDGGMLHGKRALQLAEQAGVATTHRACLGNYGNLLYLSGQFEEAIGYFERAIAILPASGDNARAACEAIASIRLAQGQTAEASELLDRIEQAVQNPKDRSLYVSRHTQLLRIRLLIHRKDWHRALLQADALMDICRRAEDHLLHAMTCLYRCEVLLRVGPIEETLHAIEAIVPSLYGLPPQLYGHYEGLLASALYVSGDHASAVVHFCRATRVFGSLRSAPDLLECDRRWNAFCPDQHSDDARYHGHPEAVMGKVSLQGAAALMLHAGHPEFLAREAAHLLHDTGCVTYAAVLRTDSSQADEIIETVGTRVATVSQLISFQPNGERSFVIIGSVKFDPESAATLNSVRILVSAAGALERARVEHEERTRLWPLEEGGLEDEQAVITGKMRELMSFARKVARTNVSVLLAGESGTGKEILARAIHHYSARSDKAFIPFNCTAVPHEMLESQLFGHRRGAFTSADRDNPGLIRAAKGGTLFLDEIGELGLDLQPKLLRFLESGEICPLGEPSPFIVDVRIIAATNRNLEQLVQDGRFREDLFYRLNVIPLTIPPLRERRDEIAGLVHHFVARAAQEFSKGRIGVPEETMEHLLLYPWPGNVRQLQNEMRRMVALADPDSVLTPATLSHEIRRATPRASRSNGTQELAVSLTDKLTPTLSRIEREMIRVALHTNHGRLDAAAKALGISRKGLYLKRHRLGL